MYGHRELKPAWEPLRLTLELTPNREPIEGSVQLTAEEARPFIGWIELVAALESVLAREGAPAAEDGVNPPAEEV
jgi:hypothetical protein